MPHRNAATVAMRSSRPPPAAAPSRLAAGLAALVVLLLAFLLAAPARAAPISADDADRRDLTAATEWCETSAEVEARAVVAGGCRFVAATPEVLSVGYTGRTQWLRLTLVGNEAPPTRRLLVVGNARLERVEFWEIAGETPHRLGVTGLAVAPIERIVSSDHPQLPLTLASGETRTLLVRVASRSSINLTPVLWRDRAWTESHGRVVFYLTLADGGLVAVGFLSLLIGLGSGISQWSRRANLFFAAGSFSKAWFNLANSALLPIYLLPSDRAYDIRTQALALAASLVFALLFMRHFLEARRRQPGVDAIFRVLIAIVGVEAVWALVDYGSGFLAMIATGAATVVMCFLAAWQARRDGVPGATALAVAWSVYLVLLAHRVVLAIAGEAFADVAVVAYSWAALASAPLVPIGIALHEEAIRRELAAARAEAEARVAFLARMSHELRTPLDTILGNAQLMVRPGGIVSVAEGVATILDAGRHLLRMIDDILDHARGLAGRLPLSPAPVDWPTFLRNLELEGRVLAARNRNVFSLVWRGADLTTLELDEGRLRQILDNLLANAARHTRDGRIELAVSAAPAADDGSIALDFAVTDTGEGIPAADLDRIFLPFERGTDAARTGKGMGMGLTIARQLVERMGGTLSVESRLGEGATFRFTVRVHPTAPDTDAPAAAVPTAPQPSASASPSPASVRPLSPTVLVVDDDAANRRILATLLASCGLTVVEAASGREAVDLCRGDLRPDLVLTDQFMADGDGWTVLRALAHLRPDLPVVVVSAAPPRPPEGNPATLAFAAHLMRPLDHAEVMRRIGGLLGLEQRPVAAPVEPPPPVARAVTRPDAATLDHLRAMIEDGRVSDIMDWAAALASERPALADFADAVAAAARRLEFGRLNDLARP